MRDSSEVQSQHSLLSRQEEKIQTWNLPKKIPLTVQLAVCSQMTQAKLRLNQFVGVGN